MKKMIIGLVALSSFSAAAGIQCNELANQELKTAQAVGEFRYKEYDHLSKDLNAKIRKLHRSLLDSADNNFTLAVFDTKCSTNKEAVDEAIKVFSSEIESELAQIALLELLKLKH